jgi:hypothetical protein
MSIQPTTLHPVYNPMAIADGSIRGKAIICEVMADMM